MKKTMKHKKNPVNITGFFSVLFFIWLHRVLFSVWIIMFENKACKNFKSQYTNVYEELKFLQ